MEIVFFDSKLEKFIFTLEKSTIAKFRRIVLLLAKYRRNLGMPYSKRIDANLYELRIKGTQEVRVFYIFYSNKIVLIHAFIKKSQKIPRTELNLALKREKLLTKR